MYYHFKIHREGTGYWAQCIELKGCLTQASSRSQLNSNMRIALNLHLEEPEDSSVMYPFPDKSLKGRNICRVPVVPRVALAFVLRTLRLKRKWTQTQAGKVLGLKGLYSYQRLESAKTANPEFETIVRIKRVYPEIELDELIAA